MENRDGGRGAVERVRRVAGCWNLTILTGLRLARHADRNGAAVFFRRNFADFGAGGDRGLQAFFRRRPTARDGVRRGVSRRRRRSAWRDLRRRDRSALRNKRGLRRQSVLRSKRGLGCLGVLRGERGLRRQSVLRDLGDWNVLRGKRRLRRQSALRNKRGLRRLGVLRGERGLRRQSVLRDLSDWNVLRGERRRVERRRLIGTESADRRLGNRRLRRRRRAGRSERKIVVFVKFFVFCVGVVREIGRRGRGCVKFLRLGDLERRRRGFVNRRERREIFGDAIFQLDEALDASKGRFGVKTGRFRKLRSDERRVLRNLRLLRRRRRRR